MAAKDLEYEVQGEISETGVITLQHFAMYRRIFKRSGLVGVPLELRIRKLRKRRSDRQNRYIWAVVVVCVQNWFSNTQGLELSKEEVYAWLRISLLQHSPVIKEVNGVEIVTMSGKRFSKMNTKEFAAAIDEIIQAMAVKGCVIPPPTKENLLTDFIEVEDE